MNIYRYISRYNLKKNPQKLEIEYNLLHFNNQITKMSTTENAHYTVT